MGEAGEVFSSAVKAKLPDINVAVATFAAEPFTLAVAFDGCVKSVGENAFGFVVGSWRFRKIGYLTSREINSHHRGSLVRALLFVASEHHFSIVVVKILRF